MRTFKFILFFFSIFQNSFAQNSTQWGNYNVESQKILATSQSYNMTEGLFNKGLRFTEFLLGTKITETEKQQGLEESIAGFQANPQFTIQETNSVDAQMQMLYQLTDPTQIALARSGMICQLYLAFQNSREQPILRKLMEKYTPVLAYDPYNLLAFTEQDFQAYLDLMAFNYQMYGQEVYFDEATKNEYRQYFVNQFIQGSVEVRQSLCVMSEVGPYMITSYQNMDYTQQQNVAASMMYSNNQSQYQVGNDGLTRDQYGMIDYTNPANIEKMWPEGVNTKAEKQAYLAKRQSEINSFNSGMQMMQNMSLENHATMMNVINNMGGGDDSYWEVKYSDW